MDSKEIKDRLKEHYNYIKSLGYEIVAGNSGEKKNFLYFYFS